MVVEAGDVTLPLPNVGIVDDVVVADFTSVTGFDELKLKLTLFVFPPTSALDVG